MEWWRLHCCGAVAENDGSRRSHAASDQPSRPPSPMPPGRTTQAAATVGSRMGSRIEPQRSSEGGDCTAAATAAQPHPGTAQIGTLKRSSSTARHNPSHSDAAQMPWPLLRAGDVQGPRTSSAWFFPRGYRWTKCSRSRTASPCCGCACVRSRARGVCVCM